MKIAKEKDAFFFSGLLGLSWNHYFRKQIFTHGNVITRGVLRGETQVHNVIME
jgi:hypothetical protein